MTSNPLSPEERILTLEQVGERLDLARSVMGGTHERFDVECRGCRARAGLDAIKDHVEALDEQVATLRADLARANAERREETAARVRVEQGAAAMREALTNARGMLRAFGRDTDDVHVALMAQIDAALADGGGRG